MISSERRDWRKRALCLDEDTNLFFDDYEADTEPYDLRKRIDSMCLSCPVMRFCFEDAVTPKPDGQCDSGVRAGMYLIEGRHDNEFNEHKSEEDWTEIFMALTMDK